MTDPSTQTTVQDTTQSEVVLPLEALRELASYVVPRIRGFIKTSVDVASGSDPDADLSLMVLALSDLLSAGAHLGAVTDIVPPKRFEPDLDGQLDLDPLREALRKRFGELDEYPEIVDPISDEEVEDSEISADIATIVECLTHGLHHYDSGHQIEGLWWWQYSYISTWGERASGVLRVLQFMLMHLRLDVPDDVAEEARYQALFADAD